MNCPGPSRGILGAWAVGLCLLAQPLIIAPALAQDRKPNVVFILADNVGYGDLGAYGGGELRGAPTPNIEVSSIVVRIIVG